MSHLNAILLSLILCFSFACNKASDSSLQDQLGIEQPVGSGGGSTLPNSALIKYAGDLQTISTSSTSANLTVKALDSSYEAMADVEVTFTLTSGSGTLSSSTVTTDSSGLASITYTGAATAEAVSIVASSSVGVVTFSMSVTSTVNSSDVLVKFSGDQQTISRNAVSAQFKVKALDSDFDPIQNVTVNYTIGSGTGTLSAASATTDVNGLAGVTYTAPNSNESVTIIATSSLGIVVFNLTVGSSGPGAYAALTFGGIVSSSVVSSTQIKVRFSPPNGGSGLYTYRIYEDSDFNTPVRTFTASQIVDEGMFYTYTVSGLTPATAYTFSVRVYDALINEEDTNILTSTSTTTAAMSPFAGIDSINNVTTSSLRLNWTSNADAVTYKVYRVVSGNATFIANVSAPASSYTVTSLAASTTYTYRVRYEDQFNSIDSNTNDVSSSTTNPITFLGITGVSNITNTSMRLSWTNVAGASIYKIYDVTSGTPLLIASKAAPATYIDLAGLTPGETYILRARAQDSYGIEDLNEVDISQALPSFSITHNGWTDVYASGPRIDFNNTQTEAGRMKLNWKHSTPSSSVISGYNLYRSTSPTGVFTKVNPSLITGVVGDDLTYELDVSGLTQGTAYYFKVVAVIGGNEYDHEATTPIDHTIIRVVYPFKNTSLAHRWIMNQDMCGKIGRGIGSGVDFSNNYRCNYNGIGSTGGYYDLGYDLVVDNSEIGCNFSRGACNSRTVGTTANVTDCVGNAVPDGTVTAAQYSVFYNRATQMCYLQTSSNSSTPSWISVSTLDAATQFSYLGSNFGNYIYGNDVNLPHLGSITQDRAWHICQTQTSSLSISGSSLLHRKRLLRKKEWTAAAQWAPGISLASQRVISLGESGITGACEGTYSVPTGSGYDPTKRHWTYSGGMFYGGTYDGGGTTFASNCRSRYGIQQMVGRAGEWTSDQFYCDASKNCTSNITPMFDASSKANWVNGDGTYFNTNVAVTGNTFSVVRDNASYTFSNSTYLSHFNPIIGMPLICNGSACSTKTDDNILVSTLTTGAGITSFLETVSGNELLSMLTAGSIPSNYAGFIMGGFGGTDNRFYNRGLYTNNFAPYNQVAAGIGARCGYPVSN